MPFRSRSLTAMVRWSDGLYGGFIAGLISALFFLFCGMVIVHEPVLGDYFVRFAVGVFGSRIEGLPIVGLLFGLFLHFFAAAIFGIFYASMASRFKPSWTAPTSVLCGIAYGFFMFFIAEDVSVPVLHVISYDPPLGSARRQRPLPRGGDLGVHYDRSPAASGGSRLTHPVRRGSLKMT